MYNSLNISYNERQFRKIGFKWNVKLKAHGLISSMKDTAVITVIILLKIKATETLEEVSVM